MKWKWYFVLIFAAVSLALPFQVFGATDTVSYDAYMAGTTPLPAQTVFDFNETPAVRVTFNPNSHMNNTLTTFWTDPVGNTYEDNYSFSPWVGGHLTNVVVRDLPSWADVKTSGSWSITGNLLYTDVFDGSTLGVSLSPTSFTVNSAVAPEPISSILFVTGGTFLAGRRLLRKKD